MRLLPLLLLAACTGPDDKNDTAEADADTDADTDSDTDADSDTDTDTDTDTAGPPPDGIGPGYTGLTRVLLVVGEGHLGNEPSDVFVYDPMEETLTQVEGLAVNGDAILDCAGDALFVLESRVSSGQNDRIVRIDPATSTFTEWDAGNNFQPRDIAAVDGGYWVANWNRSWISTFAADGTSGAFVDISAYADADNLPEANGVFTAEDVVYVTAVRQTQADGAWNGAKLLEIDPATREVVRAVDLTGTYPSGRMFVAGDNLQVHLRSTVTTDFRLNADGGVETVAREDLVSTGLLLDDATMDVRQTVMGLDVGAHRGWFPWTGPDGAPSLGGVSLLGGAFVARWPITGQVVGLGAFEGTLWTGQNPFTVEDPGAIVGRSLTDGVESHRVDLDGRVRSLTVCVPELEDGAE